MSGARSGASAVEQAIADVGAGRTVLVVDDADREDEGDLVVAAEHATAEAIGFIVRHSSGLLCAPMAGEDLDRLELPAMVSANQDPRGTAYSITADAAVGTTTGISAADRALTLRTLADAGSTPADLLRPGHVLPLRAHPDGVLARRGHTEASVDLARLAGLRPAAVIAEVVNDDGSMARGPQLEALAAEHGLTIVTIDELARHRRAAASSAAGPGHPAPAADVTARLPVQRVAEARLPTRHGTFHAVVHRTAGQGAGAESVALVLGDVRGRGDVLVRLHSECLTGDALGSVRCDCGQQLDAALARLAAEGSGVLVYQRGHEGRGIGLVDKIRAYALQDAGADTVDANTELGLPAEARDFGAAAHALADLGVVSARLLTNNPAKVDGLRRAGAVITERLAMVVAPTPENLTYLRTKRDRMGHHLPGLDAPTADGVEADGVEADGLAADEQAETPTTKETPR